MKPKLKILILEELLSEIRLIEDELERADLNHELLVINSGAEFKAQLAQFSPDIIISAYSLPDIQIVEVKDFAFSKLGDIPIIMLSGELSEDMAIEFLKVGIDDYVLKPNFKRLSQSIVTALKKRQIMAEREEAKANLVRSEKNFKQMIKDMPFPVAMLDKEMRYLVASNQWLKGLGLNEAEVMGKYHYDINPAIRHEWRELNDRCLNGESIARDEDVYVRPDGKVSWIRWKVQPWHNSEGDIGGIIIYVESIRAQKKAEQELKKSEETFRQLAENIDEVFWLTDWETRELLYISKAYEKVFGMTCESLYENSKSWSTNIHPDDREIVKKLYYEQAESGNYDIEYRVVINGETKWVRDKAFPILDENNKIYRMAGLSREIVSPS